MKNLAYLAETFLEEEGSADSVSNRVILFEKGKKVEAVKCSEYLGHDIYKETTTGKYRVAIPDCLPVDLFPQKFSNVEDASEFIQDETEREFDALDIEADDFAGDEQEVLEDMLEDDMNEVVSWFDLHGDDCAFFPEEDEFNSGEFERDFVAFLDMQRDVQKGLEPNLEKSQEVARTWIKEAHDEDRWNSDKVNFVDPLAEDQYYPPLDNMEDKEVSAELTGLYPALASNRDELDNSYR